MRSCFMYSTAFSAVAFQPLDPEELPEGEIYMFLEEAGLIQYAAAFWDFGFDDNAAIGDLKLIDDSVLSDSMGMADDDIAFFRETLEMLGVGDPSGA
jgi:hypothetical protein